MSEVTTKRGLVWPRLAVIPPQLSSADQPKSLNRRAGLRSPGEFGLDLGDEADTAGEPEDVIEPVGGDLVLSSRAEGFR
jgi:hypothetical protein